MRYGDVLPSSFQIPSSLFWLRKDLEKSNPFDYVVIKRGDVVMDCGSCAGTFAAAALEQGSSRAVCYEPVPKNFSLLQSNLEHYKDRAELIEAALIADQNAAVEIFLSGFSGAHSIIARATANAKPPRHLFVRARCFRTELMRVKPDVIKLDVEGAEYGLLSSLRPGDLRKVSCLFIEFHPDSEREAKVQAIRQFIECEGLTVVNERLRAFTAVRNE